MASSPGHAKGASKPTPASIQYIEKPSARYHAHMYPIALLLVYYLLFGALVHDPVLTLSRTLPLLAVLQTSYVVICLNPARRVGGGSSTTNAAGKAPQQRKRPAGKERTPSGQIVPALLSMLLALTLGTIAILVTMILLGAPLTTHLLHTALASAHFSLLAVMPLVYVHGVDARKWRDIVSVSMPLDGPFGAALGTFIGAWFGAVPIPLDWDREWQKWPVTIVTGAYYGYVLGSFLGQYPLKGRVIEFN